MLVMADIGLVTLRAMIAAPGEHGQEQCRAVDAPVYLRVDPAGPIRIVLTQRRQILAQYGANFGGPILVGPFARGLRARLFCDWRKLIQEILVIVVANGKVAERKRVVIANAALPVCYHSADLVRDLNERVGVLGNVGFFGRHIDAPQVHHRGIDQAIDTLDIPAARVCRFEFVGKSCVNTRIRHRDHR